MTGLVQIDLYFNGNDSHNTGGVFLVIGLVNCSVKYDFDPMTALIYSYLEYNI